MLPALPHKKPQHTTHPYTLRTRVLAKYLFKFRNTGSETFLGCVLTFTFCMIYFHGKLIKNLGKLLCATNFLARIVCEKLPCLVISLFSNFLITCWLRWIHQNYAELCSKWTAVEESFRCWLWFFWRASERICGRRQMKMKKSNYRLNQIKIELMSVDRDCDALICAPNWWRWCCGINYAVNEL